MIEDLVEPTAWARVVSAFGVNTLLSIDNALVIALAVRALPARRRRLAVVLAVFGIVALRLVLTVGVDLLAKLPLLKIIGALVLLWIGIKLLAPGATHSPAAIAREAMWPALAAVLAADAVMSLDNVVAVYAAAGGSWPAIVAALLASVPLVVFGSRVLIRVIERFPAVIVLGGALIGFVAGGIALDDVALQTWFERRAALGERLFAGAIGALIVVVLGKRRARSGDSISSLNTHE